MKQFDPHLASCIIKDLMHVERKNGLILNPYIRKRASFVSSDRTKIVQVLSDIQKGALISDYAYLCGIYMFDKVIEGLSVSIFSF